MGVFLCRGEVATTANRANSDSEHTVQLIMKLKNVCSASGKKADEETIFLSAHPLSVFNILPLAVFLSS